MSIVAGSESSPGNKPATLQNAVNYRKVAAGLLLASAILNSLIVVRMVLNMKNVQPADRTIVWCSLASIPFLFVRVLYVMLIGFDKDSKFNPLSPDIYVQSFMQILMEFICFALYISAGLLSPPIDKSAYSGGGSELFPGKYGASDPVRKDQTYGVTRNSEV
jgi:uncharacterized membrane protein (DUF485 family)